MLSVLQCVHLCFTLQTLVSNLFLTKMDMGNISTDRQVKTTVHPQETNAEGDSTGIQKLSTWDLLFSIHHLQICQQSWQGQRQMKNPDLKQNMHVSSFKCTFKTSKHIIIGSQNLTCAIFVVSYLLAVCDESQQGIQSV